MLNHPHIDPVALQIGPLAVHWYGIMYVLAFASAWFLLKKRARDPVWGWSEAQISDFIFYAALGVILGGRLGYILFYNFSQYLNDPLEVFAVWRGGMSFHGGFIGVLLAGWWFARKTGKNYLAGADFIAPVVPIGLAFGRIGNFINGELYGRVTDVPWAMVFTDAGPEPRHPSQLYQASLEGLLLFLMLWWFSRRPRPQGAVFGLFLAGYGLFRFLAEFTRQPDAHLGFVLGSFSMGQVLSVPMLLIGGWLLWRAYRRRD